MTLRSDVPYIKHILEAAEDINSSVKNISEESFLINKDVRDANVRRLEVIGEAVKNISRKLKDKHKEIEWIKIAGTRDKIIHHYFGVDYGIVWSILKRDIPELEEKLRIILLEIEGEIKDEV